jgi:hypothetical protein
MRHIMRVIFVMTAFSIGAVQAVLAAGAEDWANQNLVNRERLLCQREASGEYFFLAKAGDRVKVGTRLDMTGYSGTHVFNVAWTFQNEKDASLVAKIPPEAIKESYAQSGGNAFAENLEYQTLTVGQSKTVRVAVHVRKCVGTDCDKQAGASKRDREYKVDLCVVEASEFAPR